MQCIWHVIECEVRWLEITQPCYYAMRTTPADKAFTSNCLGMLEI